MIGNAGTALFNKFSRRSGHAPARTRPVRRLRRWALAGVLAFAVVFSACAEDVPENSIRTCRDLLDNLDWNATVTACENAVTTASTTDADTAKSLAAQARMGRAGVSLLDLLDKLQNSTVSGLALILDAFTVTVGTAAFTDVDAAINHLLGITAPTETDSFNLTVASDVILTTLLKAHLAISVNATTGALTIPGITNANLETLTNPTDFSAIQGVFRTLYETAGSYYSTTPLVWSDTAATIDLTRVSTYVRANRIGAAGIGLGTDAALASLASLNFSTSIDNGQCALSTGQTLSGADNAADGPLVALRFPRRLNTSDDVNDNPFGIEPELLAEDLTFTLLSVSVGPPPTFALDSTKEWGGGFTLPSALLNPDFVQIDCGSGFTANDNSDFTSCMTLPNDEKFIANFGAQTDEATPTVICAASACTHWPVLGVDGNLATDDSSGGATAAKTELARVLHLLFPIDNTVTTGMTGTHPAYACAAGDDLVHYREYDFYLRNFGQ